MRSAAIAIWKMCLESIRTKVSAQSFRTWFEPLTAVDLEGSVLTLKAPSNFFYEWISEHFQEPLENSLKEVLGPGARFKFNIVSEIESVNTSLVSSDQAPPQPAAPVQQAPTGMTYGGGPSALYSPSNGSASHSGSHFTGAHSGQQMIGQPAPPNTMPPQIRPFGVPQTFGQQQQPIPQAPVQTGRKPVIDSNLNPRYTFDTFIRGESNKLAYAAAVAVANNPGGTSYNPLVIYGNVGLGKTHLIQAVGNLVLQKYSGARVLYTSSDRFTVEFVDAIQNDRINEFTNMYRSIDLLIIDDVQFFAGKEKTQDIFFHTFNALRELGKQIILTCDRPPKELKDIDDRLLNRLQWGLTADMQAPDLETRIAILRHKAITDGIDLHSDVIEFIATNVTTNIRELEGCLISLLATASLEGREPNLELARDVLRKVAKRSAPILSIETIQRTVAKKFNVDEELLRAKTRKQEVVQARQVAMYLSKELTSSSLKTIGLHFGGRDHSTVIHACQTIYDDMRHNTGLATKVEELRRQFELMQ
ncbi:MAG TPA: chromosomal replication initiator protein DnaA [Candidatus Kapabacteria bacterium]|nr:chromosomal replication initiator protein DnaA [Candidatus Kapabacteria bacterium]